MGQLVTSSATYFSWARDIGTQDPAPSSQPPITSPQSSIAPAQGTWIIATRNRFFDPQLHTFIFFFGNLSNCFSVASSGSHSPVGQENTGKS